MVAYVIFDFDGTIADTYSWFLKNIQDMSKTFNFRYVTEEEGETLRDKTYGEIMDFLGISAWRTPQLAREFRKRAAGKMTSVKPFPHIKETLQRLTDHDYKLGIGSSNSESNIRMFLKHNDLEVFDYFSCGMSLSGKAHKLRALLKNEKIQAHEAIYIGDELRDIEAARKAGLKCGSVAWGYNTFTRLKEEQPDYCFETPLEIVEKLVDRL
ncbi:HAD-IA family hydrolase [Hahella sp. CR1]|uniref:HAD-IA family hydrolase n=1 Tax=unclassified Hahella TaxID=2624107 RepID=UPI0024429C2F|nr:HAD-IA family hydrolase [Hahella sp. CR1]MDG9669363.1 HAD-IA family hydrolase [Hahella sp. CR1]